jgi:hypothetical protein
MATYYSDQYRAIPAAGTTSGAVSTTNTYETLSPMSDRDGQVIDQTFTVASATLVSGDVVQLISVRNGARVGLLSITNGDFDSGTTITHKIGWIGQSDADQFGSGLTYLRAAASSTVTTQAVLDAAASATADRVLGITITASGNQAATLSGVVRIFYP